MAAERRQFEVGSVGELFDLMVQSAIFIVFAIPQNKVAVPKASYHAFAKHQNRLYLPFSDEEFLADDDEVEMELLGTIDEKGVGAPQESFEGWPES